MSAAWKSITLGFVPTQIRNVNYEDSEEIVKVHDEWRDATDLVTFNLVCKLD